MDARVKQMWIEALRSGEYKQTSGLLRDENGHCCLGVLCDIHAKETNNVWDIHNRYFLHDETLPEIVQHWAGIDSSMGNIDVPYLNALTLAELNDDGCSFEFIADVIEKEF